VNPLVFLDVVVHMVIACVIYWLLSYAVAYKWLHHKCARVRKREGFGG